MVTITETHAPIKSVETWGYFESNWCGPSEWRAGDPQLVEKEPNRMYGDLVPSRCTFDSAEKFYVNITDVNGNRVTYFVEETDDGGTLVASAPILAGTHRTAPIAAEAVGVEIAGGVAVTASVPLLITALHVPSAEYEIKRQDETTDTKAGYTSLTAPVAEYTVDGETVKLPQGFVETVTDPRTGETVYRGFGKALIVASTAVTMDGVGHVINDPQSEVIRDGDEITEIIGRNADEELLILTIIGGALMEAEKVDRPVEHETSESNCQTDDFVVETENDRGPEGNPEHTLRDEKPVNDIDTLDNIIKNPDRILGFGDHRYLIKKLKNGDVVAIVIHKNPKYTTNIYELITQLAYESLPEAIDKIINDEHNGEEPTNDITC